MTDNELIAEFMGYKRSDYVWENGEHAYTMKIPQAFNKMVIPSNMCYDTSWDWLMPVVEKIGEYVYEEVEEKDFNGEVMIVKDIAYPRTFGMKTDDGRYMFRFNRKPLYIDNTLIGVTYQAVVDWIKWHNKQKPSSD